MPPIPTPAPVRPEVHALLVRAGYHRRLACHHPARCRLARGRLESRHLAKAQHLEARARKFLSGRPGHAPA